MRPAVVKLGGSAAYAAGLSDWLDAIEGAAMPLVVVPGGGPFADQVRTAQEQIGFSDQAAHAMAILAMDQFGHVIADRGGRFVLAASPEEIADALAQERIPVWLPSAMALAAPDIPVSWDVTSDSLSAWLAGEIGAWAVLLIKQTGAFSARDTVDDLAARGVVDPWMSNILPENLDFLIAGPADTAAAAAHFAFGQLPGMRIGRVTAAA